jgi:hypothetical protein
MLIDLLANSSKEEKEEREEAIKEENEEKEKGRSGKLEQQCYCGRSSGGQL